MPSNVNILENQLTIFSSSSTASTSSEQKSLFNGQISSMAQETILMPNSLDEDFQSQLPNLEQNDFFEILKNILKDSQKALKTTQNLVNRNPKLGHQKLVNKIYIFLKILFLASN